MLVAALDYMPGHVFAMDIESWLCVVESLDVEQLNIDHGWDLVMNPINTGTEGRGSSSWSF